MIKNIVFDIGMVLVDFRWIDYLRDRGLTEEEIGIVGRETILSPTWKEMDLGARPEEELIKEMKGRLAGLEEKADYLFKDNAELVRPFEGNREWFMRLKKEGFSIYLLSNYPKNMFATHAQDSFDFMDLIDGLVVSSHVKLLKPCREIYDKLLETYRLKAEECVFLDDREENTAAAEKLGFRTVTVKNRCQAVNDFDNIIKACNS